MTLLFALSGTGGTAQTARIRWADVTIESPSEGPVSVGGVYDTTYEHDPVTGQPTSSHDEPVLVVEAKYPDSFKPTFSKVVRIDATNGRITGVWTCDNTQLKVACKAIALPSDGPIDIDALAAAIGSPELVSVVKSAKYEPRYSPTAPWPWNGPPPSERISHGKISIAKPDPASGFLVDVGPPAGPPVGDPVGGGPARPYITIGNGVSAMAIDAETGSFSYSQVISVDRPYFDNIVATLQVQP